MYSGHVSVQYTSGRFLHLVSTYIEGKSNLLLLLTHGIDFEVRDYCEQLTDFFEGVAANSNWVIRRLVHRMEIGKGNDGLTWAFAQIIVLCQRWKLLYVRYDLQFWSIYVIELASLILNRLTACIPVTDHWFNLISRLLSRDRIRLLDSRGGHCYRRLVDILVLAFDLDFAIVLLFLLLIFNQTWLILPLLGHVL